MKKRFAFVSDFDGTLTEKDFYHIIIDKYLSHWAKDFYFEWKKTRKINVEFLNKIFGSIDKSEDEIKNEIYNIPIDKHAKAFVDTVISEGGDFYIVSAGTSYYIKILLKHLGINNVTVISMEGEYIDRGINIKPDRDSRYYSEIFGIDKRKVIEDLKKEYGFVIFAGDSEPDFEAARAAEIAFARGELVGLLKKENIEFTAIDNFKQIDSYLNERGWFHEGTIK